MPSVWWSTPPFSGPPSLGVQFEPSSSVSAARLVVPESCDENQRPVLWSVTPIGSSDASELVRKLTSFHDERGGDVASSKPTRSACSPAWNMVFPLFQSAPMDGSPASPPSPLGAGMFAKVMFSLPGGGCVPPLRSFRSALAVYVPLTGSGTGANGAAATVYVPEAGLVSVTISIWLGPLPELPASEPSGAHTLRSQSPNGCSLIATVNGEDGALIVRRKLSHVGSFGPWHVPAVGGW